MFLGVFLNRTREEKFNESLTLRPTVPMTEIVTREECYINDDEKNIEKKYKYAKEHTFNVDN